MKSKDTPFVSPKAEELHRDTYRIFCFLAGVLSPAFGIIYHFTDPGALDPMWARLGLAIPTLILLSLSYMSSWVKANFIRLVHALFYLLTAYFVGITAINFFSPNYALGALLSMTGFGVAFSLGLKDLRPLTVYLSSAVGMCVATVWLTPQPEVSPTIMSISAVSTALVIYVAAHSKVNAEQTVAAAEKRYHSLMESANDAIFIADAETNRILEANREALELLGRSRDEIRRMRPAELFPPDEREHYTSLFREHLRGGEPIAGEIKLLTSSGNRVPVDISASLSQVGDKELVQAIFRDDTARQRYEKQLIEAKEHAEEMLRLKNSILNNMSHEIRTPLTGILGYAEMLSDNLTGGNKEFADIIMRSAQRLMGTLDSVLKLAQLERGETDLELTRVDLAEEVQSCVSSLEPLAEKKDLTLQCIVSSTRTYIQGHEAFVRRIANNLVSNAIKFTEEGSVTVEVGTREERNIREDNGPRKKNGTQEEKVFLRVTDTGIGIDPEFQEDLFDAFTQESTGLKRSHEGNGLGLAITKRLVDYLEGRITVESQKGKGTTFTVVFSRASEEASEETSEEISGETPEQKLPKASSSTEPTGDREAVRPHSSSQALERILVVEDDSSTRNLVDYHLRSSCEVVETESPKEALHHAQEKRFSTFLLDVSLSASMDGIDVLKALRKIPHCKDVPAVALTAHALPGDRDRFLEAGFDVYLSKPFTAEQLSDALDEVLEGQDGSHTTA